MTPSWRPDVTTTSQFYRRPLIHGKLTFMCLSKWCFPKTTHPQTQSSLGYISLSDMIHFHSNVKSKRRHDYDRYFGDWHRGSFLVTRRGEESVKYLMSHSTDWEGLVGDNLDLKTGTRNLEVGMAKNWVTICENITIISTKKKNFTKFWTKQEFYFSFQLLDHDHSFLQVVRIEQQYVKICQ